MKRDDWARPTQRTSRADRPGLGRSDHKATRAGFFARHWQGDYALWRSYWVHTALCCWAVSAGAGWLVMQVSEHWPMRFVSMAVLAVQPLLLAILCWSIGGTWMSAMKNLFGGSRLWSALALLSLVPLAFAMLLRVVTLWPYLTEHWDVAQGAQPGVPFEVSTRDNGQVVVFSGGINEGAATALESVILASPKPLVLELNSEGGWVFEGQRMADVVRRFGLSTHVNQECASACTFVFLAGKNRTAGMQAALGFHQGRGIGQSRREAQSDDEVYNIYRAAGLSPEFAQRAVSAPPDSLWVPTRQELLQAGVLTR